MSFGGEVDQLTKWPKLSLVHCKNTCLVNACRKPTGVIEKGGWSLLVTFLKNHNSVDFYVFFPKLTCEIQVFLEYLSCRILNQNASNLMRFWQVLRFYNFYSLFILTPVLRWFGCFSFWAITCWCKCLQTKQIYCAWCKIMDSMRCFSPSSTFWNGRVNCVFICHNTTSASTFHRIPLERQWR